MVILGLNDHLWKEMYGNAWTGKISDISGLIFFPLLLEYLIPVRWISVLCTGVVFTLINTSEWCNQVWKYIFQLLYDILHLRIIAHATLDWTDLYTLPILFIPLYLIPQKEEKHETHINL